MSLLDDVSIVVTPNGYKAGRLYGVIPVPTVGAEQVVNGDFSSNTWWTVETPQAEISGGKVNFNTSLTNYGIYRNSLLNANQQYKVVFTIDSYTSGAVHLNIGGTPTGTYNATGTYTAYVSGAGTFGIQSQSGGAVLSIDNVSVKEYTSADMNVTRATAATRVDENGLVNYAEVIGVDVVTNGDFATDSDWTKGTGWTISGGTANCDGSQTANSFVTQTVGFIAGRTYRLNYKLSNLTAGQVRINMALTNGTWVTADGDYTFDMVATSGTVFQIQANNDLVATIDNVSVKEVTRDNVPRIDYTGGGCPHILAEPQRTNLITYSEDFSNAFWLKTGVSVTSGFTSPDGTDNAYKLVEDTSTGNHNIYSNNLSVTVGSNYAYSCYVKIGERSIVRIDGGYRLSIDATFNLNTLVVTGTGTIESLSNGWFRLTATGTGDLSTGATNLFTYLLNNSGTQSYTGDGTSGVYIWGAQLEEGSYATSYIPNFGTALGVTRNQDIFTRDGIGSLINSTEGVLFVEMAALSNPTSQETALCLSEGVAGTNRMLIRYKTNGNVGVVVRVANTTVASIDFTVTSQLTFNKIALKYKENDFALWVNGVEVGTDTSGVTFPSGTLNSIRFDQGNNSNFLFGKVKQVQVYDTSLSDNQLIQLTGEAGTHFFESYAEMASALTYTIQ